MVYVKTDRRDARKLAGLLRAGELTVVHVPNVADKVIRDVCRGRTDAVQELMGHADVKTTEIYTHVMSKDLDAVKSPLDLL